MQATRLTFSDPTPLDMLKLSALGPPSPSFCCVLHLPIALHCLLPPFIVSFPARSPCFVSFSPLFSLYRWLPDCLALCPLPPHCLALSTPACLALSAPPALVMFSAACLPRVVYLPLLVIHCPLAPYIPYLNLIVAFILLSLPPLPCCLPQRLLNATSTMEHPHPSILLNTILICHQHHLPLCPLPPSNTARCHSHQTPSLPPPPFAVLSSSVTATALPIIHRHRQTPPPAIATHCCSHQTPSLLPPSFAVFHRRIHGTPSNATAPFECLHSPQMAAAAAGGKERWQGAAFNEGDCRGGSSSGWRLC